jgi:hypothetical protein
MKRRTSIRGIVMAGLTVIVAGLAIAALRHHFTPPADVPLSPTTVALIPAPAPGPAVSTPVATPPLKPKAH